MKQTYSNAVHRSLPGRVPPSSAPPEVLNSHLTLPWPRPHSPQPPSRQTKTTAKKQNIVML